MPHKQDIELRYLETEFRVSPEGDTPKITGYAALFNTPTDIGWTESIDAHAFDKVLSSNPDVRALWNHNADHVLGRTTASTLALNVDARGLSYVIDPPDTNIARDLIVSMRRKDVTQSSFGFVVKRDQWTENADGTISRLILEIGQLFDISPVTFPAYEGATSQVRSLPASMPVEMRSRFSTRLDEQSQDLEENIPALQGQGCTCDCPQCQADSCSICSNDECDDELCSCYNQRSRPLSADERRVLEMRLALTAHKLAA